MAAREGERNGEGAVLHRDGEARAEVQVVVVVLVVVGDGELDADGARAVAHAYAARVDGVVGGVHHGPSERGEGVLAPVLEAAEVDGAADHTVFPVQVHFGEMVAGKVERAQAAGILANRLASDGVFRLKHHFELFLVFGDADASVGFHEGDLFGGDVEVALAARQHPLDGRVHTGHVRAAGKLVRRLRAVVPNDSVEHRETVAAVNRAARGRGVVDEGAVDGAAGGAGNVNGAAVGCALVVGKQAVGGKQVGVASAVNRAAVRAPVREKRAGFKFIAAAANHRAAGVRASVQREDAAFEVGVLARVDCAAAEAVGTCEGVGRVAAVLLKIAVHCRRRGVDRARTVVEVCGTTAGVGGKNGIPRKIAVDKDRRGGNPYATAVSHSGVFGNVAVAEYPVGTHIDAGAVLVVEVAGAVGVTAGDGEAVQDHVADAVAIHHMIDIVGLHAGRVGHVTVENGFFHGPLVQSGFRAVEAAVKGDILLHHEGFAADVVAVVEGARGVVGATRHPDDVARLGRVDGILKVGVGGTARPGIGRIRFFHKECVLCKNVGTKQQGQKKGSDGFFHIDLVY